MDHLESESVTSEEESFVEEGATWQSHFYEVVRATWLTRKPSALAALTVSIASFVIILGSVLYAKNIFHAQSWVTASNADVFARHEWWRLWLTVFVHADIAHFLSNVLLFYFLGYFLAGYFGAWVFPGAAYFFSGLINVFVLWNAPTDMQLIGASGMVYWMAGAWLTLYFILDIQRSYFRRILRALGVAAGVFLPASAFDPNVSYTSHLYGFIFGCFFSIGYYYLHRKRFRSAIVRELVSDE